MNRTYICPKCGKFEVYLKEDKILKDCPSCNSSVKQKLGLNFRLKGQGFYSTDNK